MDILHFQIPLRENGYITIMPDILEKFLKLVKDATYDNFYIICSPCIPTLLNQDLSVKLFNFDMSQISVDDLMEKIKDLPK